MRQHVNPLSKFFQLPLTLPKTFEIFKDDNLPIHLDIGSARGKFLIELASVNSGWNHLGVEIRNALVVSAEKDRLNKGLENLKFCFCNANISLDEWFINLRARQLQRVSIQFPDPWFKRRHFKRKVLQKKFIYSLARNLPPGGELFIQSDIKDVVNLMILDIEHSLYFTRQKVNHTIWLEENPYHVSTEREMYALKQELPIYRALFIRNSTKLIEF